MLENLQYKVLSGDDGINVNHLQNDSRKVEKEDVFVCIKGAGFDGHKFVDDVAKKGAKAVVVMEEVTDLAKVFTVGRLTYQNLKKS